MMLVSRCSAKSFEDLINVDNLLNTMNKSMCITAGLLEDDSQWIGCLQEARSKILPRGIRDLTVVIFYTFQPVDPRKLFNQFKDLCWRTFCINKLLLCL